jgi:hypothetical protein
MITTMIMATMIHDDHGDDDMTITTMIMATMTTMIMAMMTTMIMAMMITMIMRMITVIPHTSALMFEDSSKFVTLQTIV